MSAQRNLVHHPSLCLVDMWMWGLFRWWCESLPLKNSWTIMTLQLWSMFLNPDSYELILGNTWCDDHIFFPVWKKRRKENRHLTKKILNRRSNLLFCQPNLVAYIRDHFRYKGFQHEHTPSHCHNFILVSQLNHLHDNTVTPSTEKDHKM